MKETLDAIDQQILDELLENSGRTKKALAKNLNLPLTTIHNRISKMEKMRAILGYRATVDMKKLGKEIGAFINVTVNYLTPEFSQQEIAKKISLMHEVSEVAIVTGGTDIIVKLYAKDTSELNEFVTKKLRSIKGIDKTNTAIILQEVSHSRKNLLK